MQNLIENHKQIDLGKLNIVNSWLCDQYSCFDLQKRYWNGKWLLLILRPLKKFFSFFN